MTHCDFSEVARAEASACGGPLFAVSAAFDPQVRNCNYVEQNTAVMSRAAVKERRNPVIRFGLRRGCSNGAVYRLSSASHSAYEVAVSYRRRAHNSIPSGSSEAIEAANLGIIFSHVGW